MKISVIGLGYVGLPLACAFARSGQNVIGVDVNQCLTDKANSNNNTMSLVRNIL